MWKRLEGIPFAYHRTYFNSQYDKGQAARDNIAYNNWPVI
jgi:hypothetical protein